MRAGQTGKAGKTWDQNPLEPLESSGLRNRSSSFIPAFWVPS